VSERFSAQLRRDGNNALDRVNRNKPVGDMNNSNFARATSVTIPRLLQIAMRVQF
jgi:hypothetical protein